MTNKNVRIETKVARKLIESYDTLVKMHEEILVNISKERLPDNYKYSDAIYSIPQLEEMAGEIGDVKREIDILKELLDEDNY